MLNIDVYVYICCKEIINSSCRVENTILVKTLANMDKRELLLF